jgi:glycosyltransferase involved in cell wall biosynthesis
VPKSFLEVEHTDSDLVGWGGSVHSHPNDLQTCGIAIANMIDRGMRFEVIGSGDDVARVLSLRDNPPSTGVVEFEDWANEITRLGIGIAPLADTAFNAAKSWLKPMEYSGVGVPWVASARNEYVRFAEYGGGIVVNRPRDWERALRVLLTDDARRKEMGEMGRIAAANWTIESRAQQWCDAWTWAYEHEREGV